nr:Ig-like domain-containing protein [bacterium]
MLRNKNSFLSLFIMCLIAIFLTAGCGDSGSNACCASHISGGGGSSSGGTSKYATVIFLFPDLAHSQAKMLRSAPDGTRFISFYGSNSNGDALYGPCEHKVANQVTLYDVPITTDVFFLQFRDSKHEIINLYATDKVTLKGNDTTYITVKDCDSEKHIPQFMTVTSDSTRIPAGFTAQCEAKITYGNGAVEFAAEFVDWASSATAIATVNNRNAKGLVNGISPGVTDISASICDLKDSVAITVTDAVLESITITSADKTTDFGEKAPQILNTNTGLVFTAIGHFNCGDDHELTNVTWTSSDTGIASIDKATGAVMPISTAWGQTEITAVAKSVQGDDIAASAMLSTVDAMRVTALTLSVDNEQYTCAQGYTAQFRAIATIDSAGMTFDVTDQVTFYGIDNIGTIDEHGLFTGTDVGKASVKVALKAHDISGSEINIESNKVNFEVTDAIIESITLTSTDGTTDFGDKAPQILNNNNNLVFTAIGHFSYGDDQELAEVAWTSSKPDIALIDSSTGAVTPKTGTCGQTEITATAKDTSGNTVTASIMLSTMDAMSVTNLQLITDNGQTACAKGQNVQFRAIATIGTEAKTFDVTDKVTFAGIDAIGAIDAHGLFTGKTAGTSAVQATFSTTDATGRSVVVKSNKITLKVTEAILESITITSTDGTTDYGEKAPQILNNNNNLVFSATGRFSDGTQQALTDATWASSDTGIAAINATTGAVTPVASAWGQTEITATSGAISASITLSTVDALSVT